jgi:hypothetical protein
MHLLLLCFHTRGTGALWHQTSNTIVAASGREYQPPRVRDFVCRHGLGIRRHWRR